ncbi:hypothetical protein [Methanocella conradii]|uniref:hypothetical protein n=1 Tax=Methanocella conradii TaxID=1175444 RepID=UPI0020C627CE|nr:hypothetical protein [Methanocella conradii]
MQHVIETRDLTRKFGAITAVDRLNIEVRQGEIFGSGCLGRTALARARRYPCYAPF